MWAKSIFALSDLACPGTIKEEEPCNGPLRMVEKKHPEILQCQDCNRLYRLTGETQDADAEQTPNVRLEQPTTLHMVEVEPIEPEKLEEMRKTA